MNKSSQYNQQQTEPKQYKSEVEEFTYSPKPGNWPLLQYLLSVSENKYKEIMGSMLGKISSKIEETKLYLKVVKLGSHKKH